MNHRNSSNATAAVIVVGIAAVLVLLAILVGGLMWYRMALFQRREVVVRRQAAAQLAQVQAAMKQYEASTPEIPHVVGPSLRILSWNIESGGNDPDTIAAQLAELTGYDAYALSEVRVSSVDTYTRSIQEASQAAYQGLISQTGDDDRLVVWFNPDRLELIAYQELYAHAGVTLNDGNHRSPQVCHFRHRESQIEFLLLNNHLARGNADLRTQQASGLRGWAAVQQLPVIAVGDYNLDFDFLTGKGNAAFDEFQKEDVWRWVRPEPLVDTNWADRDENGQDDYPNSMLNFAFVAGVAKAWNVNCHVIVRDGDFPDDERTSDQRPVAVEVLPDGTSP